MIPEVTKPEYLLRTEKGKRGVVLIYEKPVNGHLYVVEEVRTGRKSLSFLSMRKLKRSSARVVPDSSDLPPTSSSGGLHPDIPERSSTSTTNITSGNSLVNNHILENYSVEPSAGRVRQRSNELAAGEEIIAAGEQAKTVVQIIRDSIKDEKRSISPEKMGEVLPHLYDLSKTVFAEGFTSPLLV